MARRRRGQTLRAPPSPGGARSSGVRPGDDRGGPAAVRVGGGGLRSWPWCPTRWPRGHPRVSRPPGALDAWRRMRVLVRLGRWGARAGAGGPAAARRPASAPAAPGRRRPAARSPAGNPRPPGGRGVHAAGHQQADAHPAAVVRSGPGPRRRGAVLLYFRAWSPCRRRRRGYWGDATRSCAAWGRGAWPRCTWPATWSWGVRWRSSCCTPPSPPTALRGALPARGPGGGGPQSPPHRRRLRLGHRGRPGRGAVHGDGVRPRARPQGGPAPAGRSRSRRRCGSGSRSPGRWRRPTPGAWCTGTSSPRTSSSCVRGRTWSPR